MSYIRGYPQHVDTDTRLTVQLSQPYQRGDTLSKVRYEAQWDGTKWLDTLRRAELDIPMPRLGSKDPQFNGRVEVSIAQQAGNADGRSVGTLIYGPSDWGETSAGVLDLSVNTCPIAWVQREDLLTQIRECRRDISMVIARQTRMENDLQDMQACCDQLADLTARIDRIEALEQAGPELPYPRVELQAEQPIALRTETTDYVLNVPEPDMLVRLVVFADNGGELVLAAPQLWVNGNAVRAEWQRMEESPGYALNIAEGAGEYRLRLGDVGKAASIGCGLTPIITAPVEIGPLSGTPQYNPDKFWAIYATAGQRLSAELRAGADAVATPTVILIGTNTDKRMGESDTHSVSVDGWYIVQVMGPGGSDFAGWHLHVTLVGA